MIGKLLGNRYEIERRIGGGGMAIVYRALDTTLHRPVAVKVLRPQFAGDEEFIRRFKREARSAASLSHSNIVGVYDVGQQDDDTYYIVMEYIDGQTLKDRIKERGPMPPREAAVIAKQILDALEHAHQAQVVHRDVKPQNVLITPGNRVKVTDFGIAQAVGSATLVPSNQVLGTAHYLSPEQAQGRPADERSDIYSVGVVLYEMLSGKLPFDADTPVAVAVRHVRDEAPDLRVVHPGIPEPLVQIVNTAMAKEPHHRYANVAAMREDLTNYLAGKELVWAPQLAQSREDEAQMTRVMGPVMLPPRRQATKEEPSQAPPKAARRGSRRMIWLLAALLALGLLGAGVMGFSRWLTVPDVKVPSVVGKDVDTAQAELNSAGLRSSVNARYDAAVPSGQVIAQDPPGGSTVKRNRTIVLTISRGPQFVQGGVPNVKGMLLSDAQLKLENLQLVPRVERRNDATVPKDYVIDQNPLAGSPATPGNDVILYVSDGPAAQPFTMPSLLGVGVKEATSRLKNLNLVLDQVTSSRADYPRDAVAGQSPAPGATVNPGDKVSLVVSTGCDNKATKNVTLNLDQPAMVTLLVQDAQGQHVAYQDRFNAKETRSITVCWVGSQAKLVIQVEGQPPVQEPLP